VIRNLRIAALGSWIILLLVVAFAGGRQMRRGEPPRTSELERVALMPESALRRVFEMSAAEGGAEPADTFREVLQRVRTDYVEPITDENKLAAGAVRTMLASLDDPKTRYLDPKQHQALQRQIAGRFVGIGATLQVVKQKRGKIEQRRLVVVAPAPGGPADRAGIRAGDAITEIDGRWVIAYDPRLEIDLDSYRNLKEKEKKQIRQEKLAKLTDGITIAKALDQVSGAGSRTLKLTLERPGSAAPIKVDVQTGETDVDPVDLQPVNPSTVYLRVTQFNSRAVEELKALAPRLKSQAVILGALGVSGNAGSIRRPNDQAMKLEVAPSGSHAARVAVLVNAGTSNLAELVAGALRESKKAQLVGTKTSGDGTFQKLHNLRGGAGMTVNAGRLLTAGGLDFNGKGLVPDVAVSTGGPRFERDPAVTRAVSLLGKA
jgi:carboxyl-terminal processing protease